jgi:3-oxoacyl-[acyl-carrier-protein] synthase I
MSKPFAPLEVSAFTATSNLGRGLAATWAAIESQRTHLKRCDFMELSLPTWIGEVAGLEQLAMPAGFEEFDCRNNRLAMLGLEQDAFSQTVRTALQRYGSQRVGLFLGSSTSGLLQTERAYRARDAATGALPSWLHYRQTHNMFSLADFVSQYLNMTGPASVVSVACASSAKVFATAARAIATGVIDAAVVGGVDTLCLTTLYGFASLQLLSPQPCRPFDINRSGISIGEAAAFALLERPARGAPAAGGSGPRLLLLGFGESSDAHHMSSPHPQGLGAKSAIQQALIRAELEPQNIDYINLHGTATPSNDSAEDAAVHAIFGGLVPVSSTKAAHGHTLGAAGALEAAVSLLALRHGLMPGGLNLLDRDPALHSPYLTHNQPKRLRRIMSNSFGFGGANCSLVFGVQA